MMVREMNKGRRSHSSKGVRALRRADFLVGGAICAAAALLISLLATGHAWQRFVPLFFLVVLIVIAGFFGTRAGILGTVAAALIFGIFLLSPLGRMQVANDTARVNLGWMLLIGIGFSFLFAPPTSGLRRH
jgi:K+-sensing histidine kinase KdpD